jgi:hypothetical protein
LDLRRDTASRWSGHKDDRLGAALPQGQAADAKEKAKNHRNGEFWE